ncbi:hypothetical protein LCGC14_2038410 [marine sediment metagenome]|uniref:Recombination endonuclease VII n=1 Tax=marine sediment metagenome TaxID=412755 RepID=A0A0F9HPN9_9ZZZZ
MKDNRNSNGVNEAEVVKLSRLDETAVIVQGERRMVPRPEVEGCAICGVATQGKKLHYDHDHATGEFRGWLCQPCNTGLGMFKDDPCRLASAICYLTAGKETRWYVPR